MHGKRKRQGVIVLKFRLSVLINSKEEKEEDKEKKRRVEQQAFTFLPFTLSIFFV